MARARATLRHAETANLAFDRDVTQRLKNKRCVTMRSNALFATSTRRNASRTHAPRSQQVLVRACRARACRMANRAFDHAVTQRLKNAA
eukprot:2840655-Lingulodinium_polyedra.AAC.1